MRPNNSHGCQENHRHSIFCILPPHVLIEIANRGNEEQRKFALDALATDSSIRHHRSTIALLQASAPTMPSLFPAAAPVVHRSIFTANQQQTLPGALARSEGQGPVADASVNQAYDGLGHVFDFYLSAYHRNSIDDHNMPLTATVHFGVKYNNAFFNGQEMVFGDGDNVIFTGFTSCLDVIGHELTHGVTAHEANLVYMNQSGALNESISDVFGVLVKQYVLNQTAAQADWLIGAGLLKFTGQALRSMKAPGTAYNNPVMGHDPQPADMRHYLNTSQDNGGVHLNSGIPNRAFFLVAEALGGHAWEKAGQIWYDTLRDKNLKKTATFRNFAGLTIKSAGLRYGSAGIEVKATTNAWHQVGIT